MSGDIDGDEKYMRQDSLVTQENRKDGKTVNNTLHNV